MKLSISILILITLAFCNSRNVANHSFCSWTEIKDSFPFKNLKQFIIDTSLANDYYNRGTVYQRFIHPKNRILDSVLMTKHYSYYSWQQNTASFTAFTVLKEGFGEALDMHYLIFNDSNRLVADFLVAQKGGEPGGHKYETQSYFKSTDTLICRKTRTYFVDQKTLERLSRPVGDTIYSRQIIDSNGTVHTQAIDSILTTHRYLDENGWVTQEMIDKHHKKKH